MMDINRWHFHKDCVHYDSVVKEPAPEGKHKGRLRIKCEACSGKGSLYYCDSDFENIKTSCMYFEPKQLNLIDMLDSGSQQ